MKKIVVVGSLNMDLVVQANRHPSLGETILGEGFSTFYGGKGANQCVAAAKLGARPQMFGVVGMDAFGEEIKAHMTSLNVDCTDITASDKASTGVALIEVVKGDNAIVVVPGANNLVDIEYLEKMESRLSTAGVILVQMEIPLKSVEWIVNFAWERGIKTVLNPAPAQKLSEEVLQKATYITPNEHECLIVFGVEKTPEEWMAAYPNKLIVTQGEAGASYHNGTCLQNVPTVEMEAVDTTGAGDTFNGALAVMLAEGKSLEESIQTACVAAALSVTRLGAQSGMPTRDEVQRLLD